ncbi:MAG: winged helix-turn-helix domain-containing protein [Rhodospirillaceae bacterium]
MTEQYALDADSVAAAAKALAHPARVRIIQFLIDKRSCIGGDIVNEIGLAQSTVSEHLRILKDTRIITGEIERPRVCYSLNPQGLIALSIFLQAAAAEPSPADGPCYAAPQPR